MHKSNQSAVQIQNEQLIRQKESYDKALQHQDCQLRALEKKNQELHADNEEQRAKNRQILHEKASAESLATLLKKQNKQTELKLSQVKVQLTQNLSTSTSVQEKLKESETKTAETEAKLAREGS